MDQINKCDNNNIIKKIEVRQDKENPLNLSIRIILFIKLKPWFEGNTIEVLERKRGDN